MSKARLNSVTDAFIARLAEMLGAGAVRETTDSYLTEPRGRYRGAGRVIAPASAEEVAIVVKACSEAGIGIVPYGGGTGLVGGQMQEGGPAPVILSLERMTRIRDVRADENVLVAEGGVILADIQAAARGVGRLFPLSLASEGSARIGGLLATNAGGLNVLRYGNARAQCLGLEVVTADGAIWHGLTRLRKDNTGYDLRDLMIGSEGTLGIITAAALKLMPVPAREGTAFFAVSGPQAALELLALAGKLIGEGISAFELMHRQGFDFLREAGFDMRWPLDPMPEWGVLIDVGLPEGLEPQAALERLFEAAVEADLAFDGVIAQNEAQRVDLWAIRETIPEANRRIGSVSSHDISLPLSRIPEFIDLAGPKLREIADFRINCFGHLGDGNLHYNVFPAHGKTRDDYEALRGAVKRCVHDLTHEMEGSVSAEHGIGRLKVADLERYGDPVKLAMMRAIKDALDPKGILNPGAVLRGD
jgi:FAD/FMN-containing dehydrogenase